MTYALDTNIIIAILGNDKNEIYNTTEVKTAYTSAPTKEVFYMPAKVIFILHRQHPITQPGWKQCIHDAKQPAN